MDKFTIVLPEKVSKPFFFIRSEREFNEASTSEVSIYCDASRQAFVHNTQDFSLFFFGAIYNSDYLKTILPARGDFEDSPGFDLFCKLYEIYGNLAVKFLEGSFFILICRDSEFFLCTDPFSSVPVYIVDRLVTNSLSTCKRMVPEEHAIPAGEYERIDEYLLGSAKRLKPATVFNIGRQEEFKYWDLPKEIDVFDEGKAIQLIQATLRKSIAQRLSAQRGTVGVILSGGVDSSVITALVSEMTTHVSTFCFGTQTANEFKYARSIADRFGTKHYEISVEDQEIIDIIPEVVQILEIASPRFVEYLIPIILTYKYGKKHAQTFFNGYGSDILFGSYVPADVTPEENYQFVLSEYKTTENSNEYSSHIATSVGIDVFYPYWDKDFISCALRIDPCLKIKGSITKYILRKAFSDLLPEMNVWRPKSGVHESTGISAIFSRFLGVEKLSFSAQMQAKAKYLHNVFEEKCQRNRAGRVRTRLRAKLSLS